jgi:predicted PurR-regulated permease PerM
MAGRASRATGLLRPRHSDDERVAAPIVESPAVIAVTGPRAPLAVNVLAVLALLGALWAGRHFLVPLCAGLMLAALLSPCVAWVERLIRSRVLASALCLLSVVVLLGIAALAFGAQLGRVADRVPEMISLAADRVAQTDPKPNSVLNRARLSLQELDRAAQRLTSGRTMRVNRTTANAAQPASLTEEAELVLRQGALGGSSVLVAFASQLSIIMFLAFFVLAGGPPLVERALNLWHGRPTVRDRAEAAMAEAGRQIRLYLGVLLVTNAILGLAIAAVFALCGLPDPAGWGITAALLHVVPYLGMAVMMMLGTAETFLAFGTLTWALGMAFFLVLLSTLIGTVMTAWLQSRCARMNAAAVFVGLMFWGALWGVWGLFLGPALVVVLKVAADHTRGAQRFAQLLQG